MAIEINQAVVPNAPTGAKAGKQHAVIAGFEGLLSGKELNAGEAKDLGFTQGQTAEQPTIASKAQRLRSALPGVHGDGALLLMQLQRQPNEANTALAQNTDKTGVIKTLEQSSNMASQPTQSAKTQPAELDAQNQLTAARSDVADVVALNQSNELTKLGQPTQQATIAIEQLQNTKAQPMTPPAEQVEAQAPQPASEHKTAQVASQAVFKNEAISAVKPQVAMSDEQVVKPATVFSFEQPIMPKLNLHQQQGDNAKLKLTPVYIQPASNQQGAESVSNEVVLHSVTVSQGSMQAQSQNIASQLVEWSSIASGRLSQQVSINTLDSGRAVQAERATTQGDVAKAAGRSWLFNRQPIYSGSGHTAVMVNGMNVMSSEQKSQLTKQVSEVSASKSLGQFQAHILPHKVTFNEQLQKLYVRDYFLTPSQSEKLVQTLAQGFGQLHNIQTIVLNGHTVYQSKGGQSWQ